MNDPLKPTISFQQMEALNRLVDERDAALSDMSREAGKSEARLCGAVSPTRKIVCRLPAGHPEPHAGDMTLWPRAPESGQEGEP